MKLLRDMGPIDRFPYLARLDLNPEDLGRLEVVEGSVSDPGLYVAAATGESRLLVEGDRVPDGVWVAQQAIDGLKPRGGVVVDDERGFGEGWGRQGAQSGGDHSIPEEDAGGTVRGTPNRADAEDDSPAAL